MRSLGLHPVLLCAALLMGLASGTALADVIDEAEVACGEVGDSCTLNGKEGKCVKATCSKMSYGGGEPELRKYDCAKCVPGTGSSSSSDKKSGCAVGSTMTTATSMFLGLGVLGLVAYRRNRLPAQAERSKP